MRLTTMAEEKESAPEDLFDDGSLGSGSDAEDTEPVEPPMTHEEVAATLLAACKAGDKAECARMLEKVAITDVEQFSSGSGTNDWTVLTWAASEGHEDTVEQLLISASEEGAHMSSWPRKRRGEMASASEVFRN